MKKLFLLLALMSLVGCAATAAPVVSKPENEVHVNDLSTYTKTELMLLATKFNAFDYKAAMIIIAMQIETDNIDDAIQAQTMKMIAARNVSGYAQMFYPTLMRVVLNEGHCIPTNTFFEELVEDERRVAYETGFMSTLFNVAVDARIRIFGLDETMSKVEQATPGTLMLEGLNILQKYECNPAKAANYMGEEQPI